MGWKKTERNIPFLRKFPLVLKANWCQPSEVASNGESAVETVPVILNTPPQTCCFFFFSSGANVCWCFPLPAHPSRLELTEWLFGTTLLCNQPRHRSVTIEEARATGVCQEECLSSAYECSELREPDGGGAGKRKR